jgi:hypothetical protein
MGDLPGEMIHPSVESMLSQDFSMIVHRVLFFLRTNPWYYSLLITLKIEIRIVESLETYIIQMLKYGTKIRNLAFGLHVLRY